MTQKARVQCSHVVRRCGLLCHVLWHWYHLLQLTSSTAVDWGLVYFILCVSADSASTLCPRMLGWRPVNWKHHTTNVFVFLKANVTYLKQLTVHWLILYVQCWLCSYCNGKKACGKLFCFYPSYILMTTPIRIQPKSSHSYLLFGRIPEVTIWYNISFSND